MLSQRSCYLSQWRLAGNFKRPVEMFKGDKGGTLEWEKKNGSEGETSKSISPSIWCFLFINLGSVADLQEAYKNAKDG